MTSPSASRPADPQAGQRGLFSGRLVDAVLAAAVTVILVLIISADIGGETDSDPLAYLWAVGLGALMLVRRRYPVLVLAVSVLGLFAYYSFGYPAVGVAVPVAAALFSAAEAGKLRWAIGAALVVLAASVFFRLTEGASASVVVGYELAGHVLLMAAAMALGDGLRSRRRLVAEARRTIALTAESERRRTFERARAQREAVARDLHDALGHRTTVISLHADVAREALERGDSSGAGAALDVVTESSQAILAELRRTVRLLRAPEEASAPAGTLADVLEGLPSLVGPGMELTTSVEVDTPLPGAVDAAAVRILEEAAVNIVRHSGASRAAVDARVRDGALELTVVDDGRPGEGPPSTPAVFRTSPSAPSQASPSATSQAPPSIPSQEPPAATGYGIVGMRERAEALGGSLTAGPENGGFAVRSVLPLVPESLMDGGDGGDGR